MNLVQHTSRHTWRDASLDKRSRALTLIAATANQPQGEYRVQSFISLFTFLIKEHNWVRDYEPIGKCGTTFHENVDIKAAEGLEYATENGHEDLKALMTEWIAKYSILAIKQKALKSMRVLAP